MMSCLTRLLALLLLIFLYRCTKCSGKGKIPCATCGSRGLIKCKKCIGSGALLSCNVAIVRWYVYEFLLILSLPVKLWCWWNFFTVWTFSSLFKEEASVFIFSHCFMFHLPTVYVKKNKIFNHANGTTITFLF